MRRLALAAAILVAACQGPGEVAGEVEGYTWRRLTGPDGQACIVLERGAGTNQAVLAIDCDWGATTDEAGDR